MSTSPWTMGASILLVLLVAVLPLPALAFNMPLPQSDLFLETTNSDGYDITVSPESVNHSQAIVFTLNFIQPSEPLNLLTLLISVAPSSSPFYINLNSQPEGMVYEVMTSSPLTKEDYQFFILLFDPVLNISTPLLVAVSITVASPDMVCELATCSQMCQLVGLTDFTCSCIEGYSLQLDGLTCLANDPSPRLLLSHSASLSSFDLKTRKLSLLFELQDGNGSIDAFDYDYQHSLCYYADNTRGLIAQRSFDSLSEEVVIISQGLGVITGLAVDWISGNVYYTDSTMDRVYQYHASSGSVSVVLEGLVQPGAIALAPEPQFRFLFVVNGSDLSQSCIVRASMNGSGDPISIATAVNPIDLAVDVVLDKLMVITKDRNVASISFDGRDSESILPDGLETVYGGAIFEDYIYLTFPFISIVTRYNKFLRRKEPGFGFSLAVTGQLNGIRVYHPLQQPATADADECLIANGGCSHFCVNTIGSFYCSCPLDYHLADNGLTCINPNECDPSILGCSQGCERSTTNSSVTCTCSPGYQLDADGTSCSDVNECNDPDICSYACVNSIGGYTCQCPLGQFVGPDQHTCIGCSINNGGCSQFCVTSSNGFECQCQTGYQLSTDKTSCLPEPVDALLFSATLDSFNNGSIIIRTPLTGIVETTLLKPSESGFPSTGVIFGMDVDVERDFVYYGDRTNTALMKVPFRQQSSPSDQRQVVLDGIKAWGLSYDWVTSYLYWSEDETGTIKRALLNGSTPTVEEIVTGLQTPRGVAVDPFYKYIYWTESGDNPRVARAFLLGVVVPETLASTGLSSPSGITIDFLHRKIYWADQGAGTIWSSALNGDSQTVFFASSSWHPFQLVVTGESLVVTASYNGGQQYQKLSLVSNESILDVELVESFQDTTLTLHGIAVVDNNRQLGSDGQACPSQVQDCAGGFANITGTAFFSLPLQSGTPLNMAENPIQFAGQVANNCILVSGQFLSEACQFIPIPDGILSVQGNSVIVTNSDSPDWILVNSKPIILTLQCSLPSTEQFCLEFAVSTVDGALTCGFDNGGCSNICSNPYGPIPVCSCPYGETLGLGGHTCVDLCNPNPCANGGLCHSLSFSFTCNCPDGYSGPLCEKSVQASCPQDLCTDASPAVFRQDSGDRVERENVDVTYCSAIAGYCTGAAGQCEACLCRPGLTYRYDTATCDDLYDECNYQLQSNTTTATVYFSNGQFVSIANGESLPIVNRSSGQSLPGNCEISILEINGGDGWMSLDASGFSLLTSNSATTLQVGSDEVITSISQLSGHLLRISFSCGTLSDCFLMKVAGWGNDPATGTCDNCQGNFLGLRNLGIPEFPRPASNSLENMQIPLTTIPFQCAGTSVQDCNIIPPIQYYDDSCGLIPIPQTDLISISGNQVTGNNSVTASSAWDAIAGKLINLTLSCFPQGNFCLLFRVGEEVADSGADQCDPNPCENGGTCTVIGGNAGDVLCSCSEGYTGPFCSDVDYCADHTCLNGGTCINTAGFATCICPEGSVPPYCVGDTSRDLTACVFNPCKNGGTCVPGPNFYSCECAVGYTGLHCNTVDPCSIDPPVCGPNGTCVSSDASYYCLCPNGEVGSCETSSMSEPQPSLSVVPTSTNAVMSTIFIQTSQTPEPSSTSSLTLLPQPTSTNSPATSTILLQSSQIPEPATSTQNNLVTSTIFSQSSQTPEPSASPTPSLPCGAANPCQNGGTCFMDKCLCVPGFSGPLCGQQVEPGPCQSSPCKNGGICVAGTSSFSCICVLGFTGSECQTNIDDCSPGLCQNGGTCVDGLNDFSCECASGFTGPNCETNIDDCNSNPCQNGATCVDGIDNFTCNCAPGYMAFDCSDEINECESNPCQNGATCEDNIANFSCVCASGYTGHTCEINIDDCDPNACQNGASCIDGVSNFTCNCLPGYTGNLCSENIDECLPRPCVNGHCIDGINSFTCECSPGFTGPLCDQDIDFCVNVTCQNGGTCRDELTGFSCMCTEGFIGPFCESICPEGTYGFNCTRDCSCFNGATCAAADGTCFCAFGYTGVECRNAICNEPCQNGGTCIAPDTCSCEESFTGPVCTERECTSTYCFHGGTCTINFLQVPTCRCTELFTGARCSTAVQTFTGSEDETVGLSVGLFLGITLAAILVVAAMCFFQKTFKPWMKKVKARKMDGKVYTETTVIHENLAVTESLINRPTEAATEGGMNRPIDNPIYGYFPPRNRSDHDAKVTSSQSLQVPLDPSPPRAQVEIHRMESPAQATKTQPTDHTYSTVAKSSACVSDTVIVNRAHIAIPDDEDLFRSPHIPDPLESLSVEESTGFEIHASTPTQIAEATQL